MSSDCAEVYRLSSPSFLAPAISFCRRSGPAYKPTSAAVAFGLTCPRTDAGRTAPATNRLARRLNPSGFMRRVLFRSMAGISVGFLLDLLTFEEKIRPKFLPAAGLVEGDHRVDHLEGELVEVRVHRAARGHAVALLQDRLTFEGEHEVGKEQRRVGVRGAARHADRVGAPERGLERLPPYRGAFYDQPFGVVVVDGCSKRNLARGDELGHQRVAAAYFGFRRGELPEECEALLLAHRLDHGAEPVGVARFDPDSAREARVKQVFVGIGHFVRLDEIGVVGDGEEVEAVGNVVPVPGKGGRRQVFEVRAEELLEQLLAVHRFHLRAVGLQNVAGEAPGARLGDGALQHLLRARAPELNLHAVFPLEDLDDRHRVLEVQRSVDDDLAFFFPSLEDALLAIGAPIQVDLPVLPRIPLALSESETGKKGRSERARKDPPAAGIDSTAHASSLLCRKASWDLPMKNSGGRLGARPGPAASHPKVSRRLCSLQKLYAM